MQDRRTILQKFTYDKEEKLARPTQILGFGAPYIGVLTVSFPSSEMLYTQILLLNMNSLYEHGASIFNGFYIAIADPPVPR